MIFLASFSRRLVFLLIKHQYTVHKMAPQFMLGIVLLTTSQKTHSFYYFFLIK